MGAPIRKLERADPALANKQLTINIHHNLDGKTKASVFLDTKQVDEWQAGCKPKIYDSFESIYSITGIEKELYLRMVEINKKEIRSNFPQSETEYSIDLSKPKMILFDGSHYQWVSFYDCEAGSIAFYLYLSSFRKWTVKAAPVVAKVSNKVSEGTKTKDGNKTKNLATQITASFDSGGVVSKEMPQPAKGEISLQSLAQKLMVVCMNEKGKKIDMQKAIIAAEVLDLDLSQDQLERIQKILNEKKAG